jgi:hypothetical protein
MGGMGYLIARVIFILLMILVTSGVSMVFLGGLLEKRGLVPEGARRARLGGFIAASAACACVAAGPAMLAFIPDHIRSWLFETGGMAPAIVVSSALGMTVLTGFLAGLAGLAGKPRPLGWFALVSLLVAFGLYGWVVFSPHC